MSRPTVDHAAFTYVTRRVTSFLFIVNRAARVAVVLAMPRASPRRVSHGLIG